MMMVTVSMVVIIVVNVIIVVIVTLIIITLFTAQVLVRRACPACVPELPRSADTILNTYCSLTYKCTRNISETVLERKLDCLMHAHDFCPADTLLHVLLALMCLKPLRFSCCPMICCQTRSAISMAIPISLYA